MNCRHRVVLSTPGIAMANNGTETTPVRVFLWAIPRTLSTIFEKCMSHVEGVQVVNEPYYFAQQFGPEAKVWENQDTWIKTRKAMDWGEAMDLPNKPGWFTQSVYTYKWVKETLEAPFPGKSVVFVKDMCQSIINNLDMMAQGYRHTFLIRHPHKVFSSWAIATKNFVQGDEKTFRFSQVGEPVCPKKYGYGEQYELMVYLRQHGEPNPIIIDADDLQRSPVSIMRQYCEAIGMPFNENMLQWPPGIDVMDNWIVNKTFVAINKTSAGGFYDGAFNSTYFLPPSKIPAREDLSDDLLPLVDASMPYYEQLYDMRIRP